MQAAISIDELNKFLLEHFPQGERFGVVTGLGQDWGEMTLQVGDEHLRPGGTVSGPVMMALADVAMYATLLGQLPRDQLSRYVLAVTTSLNINFMHKPLADHDLQARCQLMKLGKRLAVGEVWIRSAGQDAVVAHSTLTYSIPDN